MDTNNPTSGGRIMRKELDEKLCAKFPKIFVNRNAPMTETAMCWGVSCGDGWYNLIYTLCNCIQSHIDYKERVGTPIQQVVATQVKEKFGALRFYVTGGDDYTYGLISLAEALSEVTCEVCGAPGEARTGFWVSTLCDEHSNGV